MHTISSAGRWRRWGILLLTPLWGGVLALTAAGAGATIRVQSFNDPAGDPNAMTYVLNSPAWPPGSAVKSKPIPHGGSQSFGPPPGTYTLQAVSPAGWRVNDIKCVPEGGPFVIDIPHGLVTITDHQAGSEQTCAFTNGKVGAPPSSGVSPSPPPAELPVVAVPDETALLGVRAGTGYVAVRLRLIKRSVVKLRLRRGERVIAKRRAVRQAGEREVKIRLNQRKVKRLKARGHDDVRLGLKAIVAELGGTTEVFRYRVIVPL